MSSSSKRMSFYASLRMLETLDSCSRHDFLSFSFFLIPFFLSLSREIPLPKRRKSASHIFFGPRKNSQMTENLIHLSSYFSYSACCLIMEMMHDEESCFSRRKEERNEEREREREKERGGWENGIWDVRKDADDAAGWKDRECDSVLEEKIVMMKPLRNVLLNKVKEGRWWGEKGE